MTTPSDAIKQGRIHGQYQSRTGGQERKCMFSHFRTRSPLRTDGRTDKASYRVASPRLKRGLSLRTCGLGPNNPPFHTHTSHNRCTLMRIFTHFNLIILDQRTNRRTKLTSPLDASAPVKSCIGNEGIQLKRTQTTNQG